VLNVGFAVNNAYAEGGKGAEELARLVVDTIDKLPSGELMPLYHWRKVSRPRSRRSQKIYGAGRISYSKKAKQQLKHIKELGMEHFPVCIAKTQYSFSTDANMIGPTEASRWR
jgi:formate--tetrahydrofolate ligase